MNYPPPAAAMLVLANDDEHEDLTAWAESHAGNADCKWDKRLADWLREITPGANNNYPLNLPIPYALVDQVDELLSDWSDFAEAADEPFYSAIIYAVEV